MDNARAQDAVKSFLFKADSGLHMNLSFDSLKKWELGGALSGVGS
ncbi:hypothetical protein [Candidatus Methylacidiphilum infernorum]|nr:hypothetical protein [Candidatus Methylacidiphilum infernorum]